MKFSGFKYERPSIEGFKEKFERFIADIESASSVQAAITAAENTNRFRREFESMQQIAYIRHTSDTGDEYYKKEQEYFDDINPMYEELVKRYYSAIVSSDFAKQIEERFGGQLISLARLKTRTISNEVLDEMKRENALCTAYTMLLASARIEFDESVNTLSQMRSHQMSLDRNVRKRASRAKYMFFEQNSKQFDSIYSELVCIRDSIARKLGYKSFIGLGYDRMGRTDYSVKDVERLRKWIKKHIVPLCSKLRSLQQKRLGLDGLKHYDEILQFKDGNARLAVDKDEILELGINMYGQISDDAGKFFSYMVGEGLMDVESRKGKSPGGYCTYIPVYKSPFIFSNFNGTVDDIDVLTHEAGHAFQMYMSRDSEIIEYAYPTLDACEIHSMSMEFITWPWMDMFFGSDSGKYRLGHISEAVLFIPYGALVDEFQHRIYGNPDMSEDERKKVWRELEKEYIPYRDYDGDEFLESGTYWYQQGHIFKNPFYYIDYVLAGICAIQFLERFNHDRKPAWNDYVNLCKAGGSMPFIKLVEIAALDAPFKEETVKKTVRICEEVINSYSHI